MKINIENPYFYEHGKPQDQTRERLKEIIELGLEEVGEAQFGIRNVISGLYIEKVWSFSETEWTDYINWMKEVINKKKLNATKNDNTEN